MGKIINVVLYFNDGCSESFNVYNMDIEQLAATMNGMGQFVGMLNGEKRVLYSKSAIKKAELAEIGDEKNDLQDNT